MGIHYSKRAQSYPINQPHGSVKVASSPENTNLLKDNIGVTLTKLEKLLGQEQNLSRKPEIFHCIGTMKTLLNSVTSPTVSVGNVKCDKQAVNNRRKGKERTTSVAVDVASYFKVEM